MWGKKAAAAPKPKTVGSDDEEEDPSGSVEAEAVPTPPSKRTRQSGEHLVVKMSSETSPAQLDKMSLFIDGESILCVSSKGTYAVDRRIGSLSYMPINISPGKQGRDIDVILGVVRFHTEQFLVVASDSTLVGLVHDSRIYCVRQAEIIPFALYATSAVKSKNDEISKRVSALEKLLSTGGFYFSPDMDVTRRTVAFKGKQTTPKGAPTSVHAPDDSFFWNKEWCYDFEALPEGASWFMTPLIHGAVHYEEAAVPYPDKARLCLICRRARARSIRSAKGISKDGVSAGLIEAEQILYLPSEKVTLSHVSVRGSCPCMWEQSKRTNNEVRISVEHDKAGADALKGHIASLEEAYDRVLLISMLHSARPEEAALQTALVSAARALVAATKGTEKGRRPEQLIAFDLTSRRGSLFRDICGEVEALLKVALPTCGITAPEGHSSGVVPRQQDFVWRTSCTDGVDRSHAMQAVCTVLAFNEALEALGLCDFGSPSKQLDDSIRSIWGMAGENLYRQAYASDAVSLHCTELLTPPAPGAEKNASWSSGWSSTLRAVAKMASFEGADEYELMQSATTDTGIADFQKWQLHSEIMAMEDEIWPRTPLNVFVGTWNVAGSPWRKGVDMGTWVQPAIQKWGEGGTDLFVFGFQEIVSLDARSLLKDTSKGIFASSAAIFGDVSSILAGQDVDRGPKGVTAGDAAGGVLDENIKAWHKEMADTLSSTGGEYRLIASRQLVGVLLCIFAKESLAPKIKEMAIDHCKTGLGGMAGNKGGVSVRFSVGLTSMCFLCGHFAAHLKNVKARNRDYATITKSIRFPQHKATLHPHKTLDAARTQSYPNVGHALGHDVCVWFGDFNYRLDNISCEEIKAAVLSGDLDRLKKFDQLMREQADSRVLTGFTEGRITFGPTYKYDCGTDTYDTSPKARAPAWCDRILFKGRNVSIQQYTSCQDMRFSDHKPVVALLEVNAAHAGPNSQAVVEDVIAKANRRVQEKMELVMGDGRGGSKEPTVGKVDDFMDFQDDQEAPPAAAIEGMLIDLSAPASDRASGSVASDLAGLKV